MHHPRARLERATSCLHIDSGMHSEVAATYLLPSGGSSVSLEVRVTSIKLDLAGPYYQLYIGTE